MPKAGRRATAASIVISLAALPGTVKLARAESWQPSAGHQQIALWPGRPPGENSDGREETVTTQTNHLVAGKPYLWVEHVSRPTLTVYSPSAGNAHAAMLVFPGGGYEGLAMDLEGTEVCDWLVPRGVTCVVVKYRGPSPKGKAPYHRAYPNSAMALQDSQRAMRLVRGKAQELDIDPAKIGVIGFSAGGHLVALMSVHFREQLYARQDAWDDLSCRPDFAVAIYPGHLALWPPSLRLNPDIAKHIRRDTPPTFLLQNEDDDVDNVDDALAYYIGLRNAQVPTEMHLFPHGGHAFGLRVTDQPVTAWPSLVETWLKTLGILAP